MRFQRSNGGVVEIGKVAWNTLLQFRQTDLDATEAGGLLLGRSIIDSNDVVIDEATIPGPRDQRFRFFFRRSKRDAQQQVNAAWNDSDGTRNYLGGWHSHPEDDPTPSATDMKDWRRSTQKTKFEGTRLLFAIVGRKQLRIWECMRETLEINALKRI